MSKDSVPRILLVAVVLCIVCSVLVSSVSVGLRDRQEFNATLDLKRNALVAAGIIKIGEEADVVELFKQVKTVMVDLATGSVDESIKPEEWEYDQAAKDPELSIEIPAEWQGFSGIRRRPRHQKVYMVMDGKKPKTLILPVVGKGLWSTLYGFMALDGDFKTVKGLKFYEHKETPGLGGEIDNPRWLAQWPGKELYKDGALQFEVIKGVGDTADNPHLADGISGATITARGVDGMLKYWMGEAAYGPFIEKLKKGSL